MKNLNFVKNKSLTPNQFPDETFEMYSVPSFSENYPEIVKGNEIGSSKQLVEKDDVLLCKINPRINRVWKVYQYTKNRQLASSEWIVVRNHVILPDYLMWYFRCSYFREYMLSNVSGVGGSLMRAQPKFVKTYPVPLPSFPEQQRIVARIESLFAKLDAAKEKIQSVLGGFETNKAKILHQTFTGELTAKWRQYKGIRRDSCKMLMLNDVCKSIYDGDHMPPPKSESGIPFLVISNVNTGRISFEKCHFVPQEYYDNLSDTRKATKGDVLFTLVGSYGIPVLVESEQKFCFQRHMALLKPKLVLQKYLWYILQTPDVYDKATAIATGTAQLTVPIKGLRKIMIPVPSESEQIAIVNLLDKLFGRANKAKKTATQTLSQIDLLKKSILARAFRGELGTQDPSDPDARELLL